MHVHALSVCLLLKSEKGPGVIAYGWLGFVFILFFQDRVSLSSPGYFETCSEDKTGIEGTQKSNCLYLPGTKGMHHDLKMTADCHVGPGNPTQVSYKSNKCS